MTYIARPDIEPKRRNKSPGRPRSKQKHQTILNAAADLVIEIGYEAATMEAIAARAGVGKQTLYRRWPSKAALYAEAYKSLVPPQALTSNAQRAEIRLANLLSHLFDLYARPPAAQILAGLICEGQRNQKAKNALREELIEGRKFLLEEIFEDGVKAGELVAGFDISWAVDDVISHIWYRLLTDPSALTHAFATTLAGKACRAG